jgi:hypothetical protein
MKFFKIAVVSFFMIFLYGCASAAKMENMAYTDTNSNIKDFDPTLHNAIGVEQSIGGESTNSAWTSEIGNTDFTNAVKSSLSAHGLFSDTGRFVLKINLINVEQPLFGIDMTVITYIRYRLTDLQTTMTIFDETIIASYTATFSDAFLGTDRLKMANEGSGKENIKGLIEKLETLKITPL